MRHLKRSLSPPVAMGAIAAVALGGALLATPAAAFDCQSMQRVANAPSVSDTVGNQAKSPIETEIITASTIVIESYDGAVAKAAPTGDLNIANGQLLPDGEVAATMTITVVGFSMVSEPATSNVDSAINYPAGTVIALGDPVTFEDLVRSVTKKTALPEGASIMAKTTNDAQGEYPDGDDIKKVASTHTQSLAKTWLVEPALDGG